MHGLDRGERNPSIYWTASPSLAALLLTWLLDYLLVRISSMHQGCFSWSIEDVCDSSEEKGEI